MWFLYLLLFSTGLGMWITDDGPWWVNFVGASMMGFWAMWTWHRTEESRA